MRELMFDAGVAPGGDVPCRRAELRLAVKDGPNGPSAASREAASLTGQEQRSYQGDRARGGLRAAGHDEHTHLLEGRPMPATGARLL
jgi:hypothetical protein